MQQKPRKKTKRWLLWSGGIVLVFLLTAGGFWYWINIPPQIKIPTPVMPNPNGYDFFLRAAAAFVPDNKGVDETTDNHFVPGKQYPLAAKEAWLKKNAKAFQLLREGLKYPVLRPPVRSYYIDFPEYAQYRKLARALVAESHARAERGDWNGAVQSALEDYHFGNKIAFGGSSISGMVSVTLRAISLRELGNIISHTNAKTAKMTASRMEKIYEQRWPLYKTLQEEKWLNISGTLELMQSPSWRINMIRSFEIPVSDYVTAFTISKRQLIHDLTQSMDESIENAHQPYLKQQRIQASDDPLVDAILPVYGFEGTRWNWARYDTLAVQVMTMYALHTYKMDNGHNPENLKTLVPEYLKKVPIDPFDGVEPLHYELRGNQYLLWSIGPDGVDNHGTPIINQNRQGNARYRLADPDDKGDVVAGINVP